jgi:membrane-associated phospholipid phosphatase
MGYDFGRYVPPPAAPQLPAYLREAVQLPGPTDRGALLVPPPPSAETRLAELDVDRRIAAARTEAGIAWAQYMDRRGATSMWWGAAQETRRTAGLLKSLELRAALVAGQVGSIVASYTPGQHRYRMERPFQLDTSIPVIGQPPSNSSYPSGHTRNAYAEARITARLDPAQAELAYARAEEVELSRIYAGAHLPSDVVAGARLGTAVGDAVVVAVHVARVAIPVAAAGGAVYAGYRISRRMRD